MHPAVPPLPLDDPRVRSGKPFTIGSTDGAMAWRAVAGRVRGDSATFAVAVPLRSVDRTVRRLVLVELLIGLAATLTCAIIGWYAVRRAFRPLTQIEDTAAAIAGGDLGRRIPTRAAKDEVTSLSRSLNSMLSQIEQSFAVREASEERMRQFVADASHELRTPLATVRGYAELYRQGAVREPADVASAMGRIEGEAGRMSGLVEDLLLLARLDDRRPMQITPVDLTVLAGRCRPGRARHGSLPPHLPDRDSRASSSPPWSRVTRPSCARCWPTSSATPSTTPPLGRRSRSRSACVLAATMLSLR